MITGDALTTLIRSIQIMPILDFSENSASPRVKLSAVICPSGRSSSPMVGKQAVLRSDLSGVWKRVMLIDGVGNEDRDSEVYWIQAPRLCGDIRKHMRHTALVNGPGNVTLPTIDAFAGNLIDEGGTFRWDPHVSLRYHAGPPDEGRLSWIGADLEEQGVHLDYSEQWTRVAEMAPGEFAVRLHEPNSQRVAYVLNIGSFVFYAISGGAVDSGHRHGDAEFSLFEVSPNGARLVLSTAPIGKARCPSVEFAEPTRRTAKLTWGLNADAQSELWLVTHVEDCAARLPASTTAQREGDYL